jgi:hypothetical protein
MRKHSDARTGRTVKALIATTLLAGGIALGGCASSPANAAVVDGTEISRETFTADVEGAGQVSQLTPDQVLSVLVQAAVAERLAAEEDITITDAEREQQLNPEVLAVTDARHFVMELADVQIVAGELGEEQFTEALRSADVRVNPRYGSWDPQRVSVNPDGGALAQLTSTQQR